MSADLYEHALAHGYVLLRGAIPPALLADLRRGVAPVIADRDRDGRSGRACVTRHPTLLEPSVYHPSFRDFLDLGTMNLAAQEMSRSERLVFGGLAILTGSAEPGLCPWHRDFKDDHPEIPALKRECPTSYIQTNCAIYDDPSLWIVPGSHTRYSYPEEHAHARPLGESPMFLPMAEADHMQPGHLAGMPGAIQVTMQAGDCLLYNPLLWHAAEYRPERVRATLHGGWRTEGMADRFSPCRWGLEHNPWLQEPSYLGDPGRFFGPQLARYNDESRRWAHAPVG
ncbi:MAG: phytanoyl-CoA dioxygenase family protein [Planctomycetes bacterium]|nr:phytanoyl-CoA dioxygenase family protein [Planctomycetota bacterium]